MAEKPHCIEHKDRAAKVPQAFPMFCSAECRNASPFGGLKPKDVGYCAKPGHGWFLRADFARCPHCVQGREH